MSVFRFGLAQNGCRLRIPAVAAVLWTFGLGTAQRRLRAHGPEAGRPRWVGRRVRRHRPETGTPAPRPVACNGASVGRPGLAARRVPLRPALSVSPAEAQNVDVSNITGTDVDFNVELTGFIAFANAFTTGGSSTDGYKLSSVVLDTDATNAVSHPKAHLG